MRGRSTLVCAVVASAAGSAVGAVRLEWDLVARTGDIGSALSDVSGPVVVQGTERLVRLELRYRLVPIGESTPRGLTSVQVNIAGSASGAGAGSLAKAVLTAGQAWGFGSVGAGANLVAAAPANPDTSGYQDGIGPSSFDYLGMMNPFRGGFAQTSDNANPGNGSIAGLSIMGVTPVTLTQPNQRPGSANGQNQWWGVYAFEFEAAPDFSGSVTFSTNENHALGFTYWNSAGTFTEALPAGGNSIVDDSLVIQVVAVPTPGCGWALAAAGLMSLSSRKRRIGSRR